jgi:DNA-directed RNA polymerase specialized sigma24 family protein
MSKDAAHADYLVGRLAMGDKAALGELIARWREAVIWYFKKRTYLTLDFEHLAGLVFDKVARKAPSYIAQGRFAGWLFAIAKNVLRDEIMRYNRERARNGLWHVSKQGSRGTQANNWGSMDKYEKNRANPDGSDASDSANASKGAPVTPDSDRERGEVVDVSFHARGIDLSARFSPRELERNGYSLPSEVKQFFRGFGLVDGPTSEIWKKSYTNMKINDSKSAVGDVITMKGPTTPNGATLAQAPTPDRTPAMPFTPNDATVATCAICARRSHTSPVGEEHVCARCEREAAVNWFVALQLAAIQPELAAISRS